MSPAPWLVELEQSLAEDTGTDNLATALVVFASVAGADVPIEREHAGSTSTAARSLRSRTTCGRSTASWRSSRAFSGSASRFRGCRTPAKRCTA